VGEAGGDDRGVVVTAALARLNVPRLEAVRAALRELSGNTLAEQRRQQLELARARYRTSELEESYLAVDRDNAHVKKMLEARLEQAQCDLRQLERHAGAPPEAPPHAEQILDALVELCGDIRALFDAPATTNLDRKQLLRLLIAEVRIIEISKERIGAEIHWADGDPPAIVTVPRFRHARNVIARMAAEGASGEAIAAHLTTAGFRTRTGIPWTAQVVENRLKRPRKSQGR
jgi:hypothetical protein